MRRETRDERRAVYTVAVTRLHQNTICPWESVITLPVRSTMASAQKGFHDWYGDYRDLAHLEDAAQPLYSKQAEMKSLPVPKLENTIERWLTSVAPLATTPEQLSEAKRKARDFCRAGGIGTELQVGLGNGAVQGKGVGGLSQLRFVSVSLSLSLSLSFL